MSYTVKAYYKHDHDQPVIITSAEEMDAFIEALLAEPFRNSVAMMYVRERPLTDIGFADHELEVGVNPEDKVGSLRYTGDGQIWHSKGQSSRRETVFYYYMGNDTEYPHDSEIPLEQIRGALKEFLVGGGQRPASVRWREDLG